MKSRPTQGRLTYLPRSLTNTGGGFHRSRSKPQLLAQRPPAAGGESTQARPSASAASPAGGGAAQRRSGTECWASRGGPGQTPTGKRFMKGDTQQVTSRLSPRTENVSQTVPSPAQPGTGAGRRVWAPQRGPAGTRETARAESRSARALARWPTA